MRDTGRFWPDSEFVGRVGISVILAVFEKRHHSARNTVKTRLPLLVFRLRPSPDPAHMTLVKARGIITNGELIPQNSLASFGLVTTEFRGAPTFLKSLRDRERDFSKGGELLGGKTRLLNRRMIEEGEIVK